MPIMNIFIIILLIDSILAINDTNPELPSHFVSDTKLLPQRSDSTKTDFLFQEYIPIACICDRSKCNARVQSIESPIVGLLTRDGNIVQSLDITVNKDELMYIILIDGRSDLANDTYLERISYWQLTDGQQQVLPGASIDLEILRQVSTSVLKTNTQQFIFESKMKSVAINILDMSTGLPTLPIEESEGKTIYHYAASPFSQIVGVYQLFHELTIHPSASLSNYIENQTTGAQCSSYIVFKEKCGFLQLLPSFIQQTSVFHQVAVDLPTDPNSEGTDDLMTENNRKSNKKSSSTKTIEITIVISIVCISLGSVAALWYYHRYRYIRYGQIPIPLEDSDDDSDNHELLPMSQR